MNPNALKVGIYKKRYRRRNLDVKEKESFLLYYFHLVKLIRREDYHYLCVNNKEFRRLGLISCSLTTVGETSKQ